jgi:hypothetical protein
VDLPVSTEVAIADQGPHHSHLEADPHLPAAVQDQDHLEVPEVVADNRLYYNR